MVNQQRNNTEPQQKGDQKVQLPTRLVENVENKGFKLQNLQKKNTFRPDLEEARRVNRKRSARGGSFFRTSYLDAASIEYDVCRSLVSGKAMMLVQIISYIQSPQRQVELLLMKLETVKPRLDFNLEGLLAKDTSFYAIIRACQQPTSGSRFPSLVSLYTTFLYRGFSPGPVLHLFYYFLQKCLWIILNYNARSNGSLFRQAFPNGVLFCSDIPRQTISSHLTPLPGGIKESTQLPNVWADEVNNVA
ncbi:transcription factor HBI1 [Morus notabilis]|uniref:transcription factor HBI1 n=1 Tax=Morus notabilis TaxID=981085 RepID=UPI000CECF5AB|nr:transcription factor HBI1 [Morus notabilis]